MGRLQNAYITEELIDMYFCTESSIEIHSCDVCI